METTTKIIGILLLGWFCGIYKYSPKLVEKNTSIEFDSTRDLVLTPALRDTVWAKNEGVFVDDRDGKEYRWVRIDGQIWMAEDLKFRGVNGCFAFKNKWKRSSKRGYLYTRSAAQNVAPKGWHIPSQDEVENMIISIGGINPRLAYDSLKHHSPSLELRNNGVYFADIKKYTKGIFPFKSASWWTSSYALSSNKDTLYSYFLFDKFSKRAGIKFTLSEENARPVRCIKNH